MSMENFLPPFKTGVAKSETGILKDETKAKSSELIATGFSPKLSPLAARKGQKH